MSVKPERNDDHIHVPAGKTPWWWISGGCAALATFCLGGPLNYMSNSPKILYLGAFGLCVLIVLFTHRWVKDIESRSVAVKLEATRSAKPTEAFAKAKDPARAPEQPKEMMSSAREIGPTESSVKIVDRNQLTNSPVVKGDNASVTVSPSAHVYNAPGGIINVGPGSIQNATVINQGQPPAKVIWKAEDRALRKLPPGELMLSLRVDNVLSVPAFLAVCDQPCSGDPENSGANQFTGGVKTLTDQSDARRIVLTFLLPRPLAPGHEVFWKIKSMSGDHFNVQSVEIIPADRLPQDAR